jgi:flagellar protein FlgJ
MNLSPLQAGVPRSAELPVEKLAGSAALTDEEKVAAVTRQFEAVLLRQVLQQARKTVFPSKFTNDNAVNGIYQDLVNEQLADAISRAGTLGLARSLQSQLTRQVLPDANPSADGSLPDDSK